MTSRPAPLRLVSLAAVLLTAAACGDGDAGGDVPDRPSRAVSQVVGSDLEEWSLLSVPTQGGTARAHAVGDPSRVIWTGDTELPRARSVHLLDGPLVVLRTPTGDVYRYDPLADEATRVGAVEEGAEWVARGRYGVFREPEGGLLHVGPEGAWRHEIGERPVWAGPVEEGGVAVVVEREDDGSALWLVRRGATEPETRADSAFAPPALVTGWGRRLVGVGPSADALRFVAVPSLGRTGEVALDGPVHALAVSPSSHEIYAGVGAPPRVVRVGRFDQQSRVLVETDREVQALRPAVLGSSVLVHDGGDPLWLPLEGGPGRRIPGEWRADLPMGMPDGRVLLVRDGALATWSPSDDGAEPVDAPAGRWWATVRWNPAPSTMTSERVAAGSDTSPDPETPSSGAPAPADSLVPDTVPGAGGEERDAERTADEAAAPGDSLPAGRIAPGHYAVVTAARDVDGVRRLLERLSEAGHPTAVDRYRDDAGRLWHRGMVGPYDDREEAEAAARQLRREEDVDPWVTEIRAGAGARDAFP